ncbi:MAG: helix-turn-helix transcriptional regulator [Thermodesulfobacteriota bacterium]|nr:helix-turn-helix transcriptional regulator [Thermodesulfobacteriota bacterium]
MLELTKKQITNEFVDIHLCGIPADKADQLQGAIEKILDLAGMHLKSKKDDDERVYSAGEVFPNFHAGNALRGLRFREELTQKQLAEIIESRPSHISEMEGGKRPIGKGMAKRLAKALSTDYKIFL